MIYCREQDLPFSSPIFVLGQDENQGTITEIVNGQKSDLFCVDKSQPQTTIRKLLYYNMDTVIS